MFTFQLINTPKSFRLKEDTLKNIFAKISKTEKDEHFGLLNIVFVSEKEIKNYNKNYRKKDSVTDVLSFHYFDDYSSLSPNEVAGEIILCESKVISQGKEYRLGSELECYKLIIHSILHILGYDHEEDDDYVIMNRKEHTVWNGLFT